MKFSLWHLSITSLAFFLSALLLGIFLFVYGGYDDSPGAQGLGVLSAVSGLAVIVKKPGRAGKGNNIDAD